MVTLETLQKVMNGQAQVFSDALKQRDERIEARFNQFAGVLQQVVDAMQKPQQQEQGGQINSLANRLGIPQEAVNTALQQVVEGLGKKYLNLEQPASENDRLLQLLKLGAERELKNTLISGIRRSVRRGLLYSDEVDEVLPELVDKAVGGGSDIAGRTL